MLFILNPLIINTIFLGSIIFLFMMNKKLLGSLIYRSSNVFQYKIYNIYLSFTFVFFYISIIIILLYIIRLYNLPRSIDLKTLYIPTLKNSFLKDYTPFGKFYLLMLILLLIILCILLVIKGHKLAYKEIHKIFLWLDAHPNITNNKIYVHFKNNLHTIYLFTDIFLYLLMRCAKYFQTRLYKNYDYANLPKYNLYKFICICDNQGYYNITIMLSPILFILYDILCNNFIITNVFYYLLFYIPLRLIKRIVDCISCNASYINKWLYDLYYKDEDCLYAVSPNLKAILDNFILSGVIQNYTLGVQCEAELIVCALTRFELADKNGPLDETYVNEDSQFLHTYDRLHYYHVIPNDNGNPIHGVEWFVIFDKTKHLKTS